jgi:large subunit ribosomal protein L17
MRHNRQTHRLNRAPSERRAMIENMVTSLMNHQQIKTTLQKAKAAQRLAERVITLGKKDSLHARRQVFAYLQDHQLTSKIFKDVAPRFKNRTGGYTRILHLNRRKGDGAQLALLELTEKEIIVKDTKTKGKKASKPAKDHEHKHETGEEHKTHGEKESRTTKPDEKAKPQKGFFKNIGKFFRNKGGS